MRTAFLVGAVLTLVAAPLVAAQNTTNVYNNPGTSATPTVQVNVNNPSPSESTGIAGLSGTALIVLVVLAVIVVALIVALASRDRYP